MPKSKRDKKVSLTQTKKKGLEQKQKLVEEISMCLDHFKYIYAFSVHNMRNSQLKVMREEWKSSRFFFGKNKVMARALLARGAEQMARQLQGQMGLLFTNKKQDAVLNYFENFRCEDFARAGNKATRVVVLEAGPLLEFSHAMEPQLRQLGLPTSLKRGVVTLDHDHTVCKEGDVLTVTQARILKQFGHKMAEFKVTMESMRDEAGKWHPLSQTPSRPPKKGRSKGKTVKQPEPETAMDLDVASEEEEEDDDDDDDDDET